MNRDDILRWSRSAIRLSADGTLLRGFDREKTILDRYEFLCWFASNVATDVRKEEREACAKLCDDKAKETFSGQCQVWGDYFARAIRARSNVQQEPQK